MPRIDFEARRPWLAARLDELVEAGTRILVVEVDGRPAAFATLDRAGVIDQIAVDPADQGRGIASALIAGAKALSPDGLELIVNRDNTPARRLYERHEFEAVGTGTNPASGLPTLTLRWEPRPVLRSEQRDDESG